MVIGKTHSKGKETKQSWGKTILGGRKMRISRSCVKGEKVNGEEKRGEFGGGWNFRLLVQIQRGGKGRTDTKPRAEPRSGNSTY